MTNKELRERFNPDGSMLRKQQLRMLEMLKFIDAICKKHDIKYWLSSGTLLGAVRHGGFIPWDDDLDIEMLKSDYKKFLKIMKKELKDNKDYALQTHEVDPNYYAPYAKLRDLHSFLKEVHTNDMYYNYHGIYIDIFAIEPSASYLLNRLSGGLQNRLIYGINTVKNGTIRKCCLVFNNFILTKIIFPCVSFCSKIGAGDKLRHIPGSYFTGMRIYSDIFPLSTHQFENENFPVPGNSPSYLQKLYGDYMTIPNLDKINVHLSKIEFYDK
jgi:lipopolysaccharide cholinephosphotransferase